MKNIDIKSYKLQVTSKYSVIASETPPLIPPQRGKHQRQIPPLKGARGCSGLLRAKDLAMTVLIVAFCFLFSVASFAQCKIFSSFVGSGGNGTQGNPYLISTPADLMELSNYVNDDTVRSLGGNPLNHAPKMNTYGKYFKMTNDTDMTTIPNFVTIGGAEMRIIGSFPSIVYKSFFAVILMAEDLLLRILTSQIHQSMAVVAVMIRSLSFGLGIYSVLQ